jgi:hypothetical protein
VGEPGPIGRDTHGTHGQGEPHRSQLDRIVFVCPPPVPRVWVARVTGIAVARRPRAYPLTFGPGSVAVVRGWDSDGRRGPGDDWVQLKYLGTRGSPRWIILRKHPRVRGLPLPEPDTLWLVHTQKKQEQDPYRSDDSTTPHRNAPRANRILRARGRALAIRAACSWRARPQPTGTELCPQHPCS